MEERQLPSFLLQNNNLHPENVTCTGFSEPQSSTLEVTSQRMPETIDLTDQFE
jgi:hypothetical protein